MFTTSFAGKDLGKQGDDALKYFGLIWIPSYSHILCKQFGDMYTTDGTHKISHLGWRAMPICVVNSLGNPHAVAMIFCTTENSDVLIYALKKLGHHCQINGVISPFSTSFPADHVDARDIPVSDNLDEAWICSPDWRNFVDSVLHGTADLDLIPDPDARSSWITDQGPAFLIVGKTFNLRHVLCKMHLDSHNHLGSTSKKELGKQAKHLLWSKDISTTTAVKLCKELIAETKSLPASADTTKRWASDTFNESMMKKSVMAFHVFVRTLSWRVTSCVENVFNIWKKFQSAKLKRSLLHDAVEIVLNVCERRFQTDAIKIAQHPKWFVDMTHADDAKETVDVVKSHEKKLGVGRLFLKEKNKLQDVSICSWTEAIKVDHE